MNDSFVSLHTREGTLIYEETEDGYLNYVYIKTMKIDSIPTNN